MYEKEMIMKNRELLSTKSIGVFAFVASTLICSTAIGSAPSTAADGAADKSKQEELKKDRDTAKARGSFPLFWVASRWQLVYSS
jgi:hypothetical protein